jgi:hypothetical protein
MVAARPDWLGIGLLVACVLAVGVVSTAEIIVELVEYPTRYSHHVHATSYLDTLADLANSLVGAVVGSLVGALAFRR